MPIAFILVGVPGSGKSTWAAANAKRYDAVVVSTDAFVELSAAQQGKPYDEVFVGAMPAAVDAMVAAVVAAKDNNRNIIWDQTSTTRKTRAKKVRMLEGYDLIAVVFTVSDEVLAKRLASRPGKTIPAEVVASMRDNFEAPSLEEGFDLIIEQGSANEGNN